MALYFVGSEVCAVLWAAKTRWNHQWRTQPNTINPFEESNSSTLPRSSAGSLSASSSRSAIFALREQPENHMQFIAALEFFLKYFDGQNMPVSRFVNDCVYARNLMAAKERHYLFLMIRTQITGVASILYKIEIFITWKICLVTLHGKLHIASKVYAYSGAVTSTPTRNAGLATRKK